MIIGVTGKKYSGKDTLADYLVDKYNFKKYTFAEPLKQCCKVLFTLNDNQFLGDEKEKIDIRWNRTPRQMLQFIGTDMIRKHMNEFIPVDEDFWILSLLEKIKNDFEDYTKENIVISDVRFPNEEKFIHKLNGIILKIDRNLKLTDNHSSENHEIKYDEILYNTKSIVEYYETIDYIIYKNK